jgi:(p)ppGpp synthase/HD superfamily hydrolase
MSKAVVDLARALDFAARKHAHQRRKGEDKQPYVNHLADVARLVAQATGGRDATVVVAALLHDTIEDTGTKRSELSRVFGSRVAAVVAEVTDDKRLPKQVRKRLQVEQAKHKSRRARIIKIADKTSNLRSLLTSPPVGWSAKRQLEYLEWSAQVVAGCRGVNLWLERQFDAAHRAGLRKLRSDAGG